MIKASDGDLERSIEACEHWEWYGGGLVFAGVAAAVAIAAIHPQYDSFWEQWGSAIADSLVAIGVAVEIKLGQMAGLRQSELKRRSDEKVAEAGKVADIAKADAAKANEAAAKTNERAALLEKEAASLRNAAAWRSISSEQYSALISALSGQTFEVWASSVGIDPEAMQYRFEIDSALTNAGLTTKYFSGFASAVGLQITEVPGPEFNALITAFAAAQIPFTVVSPEKTGTVGKELSIIVGSKPPPFFGADSALSWDSSI